MLNGGYFKVNYEGQSFGATINSGLEIVSGGAFASGTVINSGGNLDVFGSASETNATIGLGGFEYVAGTASDDLIAGGRLEVASGGVYSGTVSFGGPHGTLQIDQQAAFTGVVSGFAIGDLVEFAGVGYTSGDFATVSSTGSGNSLVTVETASRQAIETFSVKGAYPADDFVASAAANGSLEVQLYSPTITYTIACNKTDTLWTLSGSTWVSATSAVSGPLIGAFNEAIAVGRDDTIFDDFVGANQIATGVVQSGAFIVNAGGEASATVVASGGVLEVQAGGSAYGAKVSAGGALQLYSGFIADQMTISAATYVEVGNGARYAGFTACNNSEWIVESGGLVTGMTVVGSAGVVDAYANGGEFLNAAIELGGSLDNCGGLLSGGSIVDDGFALVYNSGSDAGTLIAYGGDLKVASGGHASADQLGAGGLMEIASGGVYSASLAFSGPNALLQIDQGGQFNGVISGFGADDAILFSGLQYASGDSATFGSNGSGGGTVSIANASHHQIASFTVSGLYSADEFVVAAAADDALEVSLSSSAAQYTIAYGQQETIWTLNGSTWTSSTTVTSGPVIGPYVSAVGSGKDDTIFDDYVGAGDIATGVVKGGQFLIESGGEALSAIVQSGGNLVVSGGYAASTTISGGMEIVEAGGSVVSTTVSCSQASGVYAISQQLIMSGGSASRSSAGANGDIFVYAGGALSSSFASNGGMVAVEAGGQLSSANIQSGGILELYQATTVKSVVVSRGATFEPFLTSNYGSWTQISGSATVLGATLASGVTIDLCVCSGGAISNYVAEGGYQTVYAGGAATSAVVALGANLEVWGTVSATTVASGSLTILAGATDIGAIVEQGGFATDAGSDSGDSIVGGTLEIASGGLYSGALGFTGSGGLLEINSQGGFGGMVSGFTADDVIEFAGLVYSAGDVAAFSPTGSSGGEVTIYNAADQQIASLAVSGKYSSSSFVASGGAGGRLVLGLSASQASVISYNQFNTIWTSKGTKWSSATSATAGPVIGPFAFAVGSGHDDLIWENDVGSGQIATGLVSGGVFDINSGGEVSAVTIAANGVVSDYEGSLVDALVEAGGSAYIDFGAPFNAGGGAFSVAVASGGSLFVDASTTVSGVVVSSGGSLIIAINQNASAASLPGAQVQAGGNCLFEINSGITLSGATIVAGQSLTTEGGGVGQSLVVDGGSLDVNSAARSLATYIEAGGAEIFAGGSASGDLIAAGADELVLGGAADDVISGGRLEIGSGGALSGSLTFAGSGGLLALDSGATFAATVSGFVVGDEVEFKSLAYASGDQAIFKAAGSSGGSILIETAGGARLASFAINNGYAIGDDYCVTSAGGGTAVAVNSAGPVVTVAVYTANEAALDEYLQGFAIRDTAANVSPEFASFCADAHLNAITVVDNGVIAGVTISELSSDAPRFRMISDANGLPYQLGLGDTANNVASALTTEVADIAHIASIALTDVGAPQLDVTAAQADDDVALFEKIVNPLFDVMGAGLAADLVRRRQWRGGQPDRADGQRARGLCEGQFQCGGDRRRRHDQRRQRRQPQPRGLCRIIEPGHRFRRRHHACRLGCEHHGRREQDRVERRQHHQSLWFKQQLGQRHGLGRDRDCQRFANRGGRRRRYDLEQWRLLDQPLWHKWQLGHRIRQRRHVHAEQRASRHQRRRRHDLEHRRIVDQSVQHQRRFRHPSWFRHDSDRQCRERERRRGRQHDMEQRRVDGWSQCDGRRLGLRGRLEPDSDDHQWSGRHRGRRRYDCARRLIDGEPRIDRDIGRFGARLPSDRHSQQRAGGHRRRRRHGLVAGVLGRQPFRDQRRLGWRLWLRRVHHSEQRAGRRQRRRRHDFAQRRIVGRAGSDQQQLGCGQRLRGDGHPRQRSGGTCWRRRYDLVVRRLLGEPEFDQRRLGRRLRFGPDDFPQ